MKRLTVPIRLFILLSLPLSGAILFGAWGAWSKWKTRCAFTEVRVTCAGLVEFGEVIHELQRERGRSNTFCASRGKKFVTELPAQQKATDVALAKLHSIRPQLERIRFGSSFDEAYRELLQQLDQLAARRDAIAQLTLTGPESTAYFTELIDGLLRVMILMNGNIDDAAVSNAMGTFVTLGHIKEFTGIERALLAGTFAADKFGGDTFARVSQAIAGQEAFFRVFLRYATAEHANVFKDTVRGEEVEKAAALRKVALDRATTGGFGVEPGAWFDAITIKIDLLKKVADEVAQSFVEGAAQKERLAQSSFVVYASLTSIIFGLTIVFGLWAIRSITRPLRSIIAELGATAYNTASAANQVSESSQLVAQGASEQAARLEETSAAVTEIVATTRRNAENAQRAKEFSTQTSASANTGATRVGELNQAMTAMKHSSDGISKIIKTIDEIAFQTNILALNAAVEAARAGEAGLGFAVVAEEVRNLAQRSAQSAKESAERIEEAIRSSQNGVQISSSVSTVLGEIVENARKVDGLVVEIAEASNEQNRGIEQVSTAVAQMDHITQSSAGNAEETAAAAEELSAQACCLREVVKSLEALVGTKGSPVRNAVTANVAVTTPSSRSNSPARPPEKTRLPARSHVQLQKVA